MTDQQTNPPQSPHPQYREYREDYKVKKLLERIEAALKVKESSAQASIAKN
jgi:hypothetical protein